jgi:hypothetical protein
VCIGGFADGGVDFKWGCEGGVGGGGREWRSRVWVEGPPHRRKRNFGHLPELHRVHPAVRPLSASKSECQGLYLYQYPASPELCVRARPTLVFGVRNTHAQSPQRG